MKKLTDEQLAAAAYNLAEGKASLACEGMYLTQEEEDLFAEFQRLRLPHDERRRRLIDYSRAKRAEAGQLAAE